MKEKFGNDFSCPNGLKLMGSEGESVKSPCGGCGDKKGTSLIIRNPRPSCKECVEKHIGSAIVLLGEVSNGYDHFLLAVGHLHEAEEESAKDWPELSKDIRAARKQLQKDKNFEDWSNIIDKVEKL